MERGGPLLGTPVSLTGRSYIRWKIWCEVHGSWDLTERVSRDSDGDLGGVRGRVQIGGLPSSTTTHTWESSSPPINTPSDLLRTYTPEPTGCTHKLRDRHTLSSYRDVPWEPSGSYDRRIHIDFLLCCIKLLNNRKFINLLHRTPEDKHMNGTWDVYNPRPSRFVVIPKDSLFDH